MKSYGFIEKKIAELLRYLPGIKRIAKYCYQKINFILYKKHYKCSCVGTISVFNLTNKSSFFGYYDKSPVSLGNEFVLYHSISQTNDGYNMASPELVLFNATNDNSKIIDSTTAYNWQQGCRLQWISDNEIIYNVFADGMYKSKIFNTKTDRFTKTIDFPVYDCYLNKFALSVSFERLAAFNPDYGYFCKNDFILNADGDDGIFFTDLNNSKTELIFSIQQAKEAGNLSMMHGADHLFNHIMISPDGTKFIFIHRWYKNRVRFDRLLMYNLLKKEVTVLVDDGMVSHCCWRDNQTVAGYFKYKTVNGYYQIDTGNGNIEPLHPTLTGFPDGHPSFYGDKMVFDTYPDKSRMQNLYVLDFKTDKLTKIGEFLAPFEFYAETRCDLHPKWAADGKSVFIDSTHNGKRCLYNIKLETSE